MSEQLSNPFATSQSDTDSAGPRRPVGTLVWAALLLFYGVGLGGGTLIHAHGLWSAGQTDLHPREYTHLAHFAVISVTAICASIGLLFGHRTGWWAALLFSYIWLASFIVLPSVRHPTQMSVTRSIFYLVTFVLLCYYLHRRNVLTYFRQTSPCRWQRDAALFVLSVIVVLGLGIW